MGSGRDVRRCNVTGARTPVTWFKICPVVLGAAAALLLLASFG